MKSQPARSLIGAKIAATRKRHLACLRANRDHRRILVARLYADAVAAGGPRWGDLTRWAASMGISKSTCHRDLAAVRQAAGQVDAISHHSVHNAQN